MGAREWVAYRRARRAGRATSAGNRLLLVAISLLAALVSASLIASVMLSAQEDKRAATERGRRVMIRDLRVAIAEADAAAYGYALTSQPEFLGSYFRAAKLLTENGPRTLAQLPLVGHSVALNGAEQVQDLLSALLEAWGIAIDLVQDHRPGDAVTALHTAHEQALFEQLRDTLETSVNRNSDLEMVHRDWAASRQLMLRGTALVGIIGSLLVMIVAIRRIGGAIASGQAAGRQIEQLFIMGDMLQSAIDLEDTNAVLRASAIRLMPDLTGALYVFNNARDQLDLATHWGDLPPGHADHMAPSACWALKRGKAHLNEAGTGALRCAHSGGALATLDIPMMARGQLYGLLEIIADGPDAIHRLEVARPIATAIGDAMSLALSNAALRDQLRQQALRDGLTGLYNRRFLEETLDRLCQDSERRCSSIAMIMLDLDHFKQLNDSFGHPAGDAVLREVAATISASIRATDLPCRYGGEEMVVLLPDCGVETASTKAEVLRNRIASLALAEGMKVTASFGVAAIPATSASSQSLLSDADAALYQAKTSGRDRVAIAATRQGRQKLVMVGVEAEALPADAAE